MGGYQRFFRVLILLWSIDFWGCIKTSAFRKFLGHFRLFPLGKTAKFLGLNPVINF